MTSLVSWITLSVWSTMLTEKSYNMSSNPTARVYLSQKTPRRSTSGMESDTRTQRQAASSQVHFQPTNGPFVHCCCTTVPCRFSIAVKSVSWSPICIWQTNRTDSFCASSPSSLSYVCCRLYVNWRFLHGIEAQFLALQKGFNEVIPQHLLKSFDEKELEVKEKSVLR